MARKKAPPASSAHAVDASAMDVDIGAVAAAAAVSPTRDRPTTRAVAAAPPVPDDKEKAADDDDHDGDEDNEDDDAPVEETGDDEDLQRDKTLLDLLAAMDDYQPIIPDAVTDFYLTRSGFDCPDVRVKRLLALTAQKFIADVAQDAYQYSRMRQQAMSVKDKRSAGKKTVLTMEDLSAALSEYGVHIRRPDYYM